LETSGPCEPEDGSRMLGWYRARPAL